MGAVGQCPAACGEDRRFVIKPADYVIDLGPEGGAAGGDVIAAATPEEVAANRRSYAGQCLADLLGIRRAVSRRAG
jgi:excinuclease ABC subunit A